MENCKNTANFSALSADSHAYVFYSLREAIHQFRREYGLQRKHIRVIKLY